MTAAILVMVPAVLSLGFWQLERAAEKRSFEQAYLAQLAALPKGPAEGLEDFQRLRLTGRFEADRSFLVDNQTHAGRVGYAVVTSFLASDGRRWLINRGFVAGEQQRDRLPVIATPAGPVELVGVVWPELGLMPVFGPNRWEDSWPKRIQRLEVERMAAELEGGVAREIRLEAGQPGVLAPPSLALNMPASKHTAYAVQWFALAAALGAAYLFYGFRRHE
jgi:cytochrome oxidase assembly protein ShyY1